jgi:hypothetical protein
MEEYKMDPLYKEIEARKIAVELNIRVNELFSSLALPLKDKVRIDSVGNSYDGEELLNDVKSNIFKHICE